MLFSPGGVIDTSCWYAGSNNEGEQINSGSGGVPRAAVLGRIIGPHGWLVHLAHHSGHLLVHCDKGSARSERGCYPDIAGDEAGAKL